MTTSSQLQGQLTDLPQRKIEASSHAWPWLAFWLSAIVAIGFFFVPAFIIRPFAYQAPRALLVAMALRQRAPIATLLAGFVCLLIALALWRVAGIWRRLVIAVVLIVVAFSAAMARLNYFEWMFHPIDSQQFIPQSESKLGSNEMILAVNFGNDARAYPIRQMAYHHILNDVVAGTPIAVTY